MLKKSLNSTKNQHANQSHNMKASVKLKTEQDEPSDYHHPQIIDQLNDDAEGLRLQLSPDRYIKWQPAKGNYSLTPTRNKSPVRLK